MYELSSHKNFFTKFENKLLIFVQEIVILFNLSDETRVLRLFSEHF